MKYSTKKSRGIENKCMRTYLSNNAMVQIIRNTFGNLLDNGSDIDCTLGDAIKNGWLSTDSNTMDVTVTHVDKNGSRHPVNICTNKFFVWKNENYQNFNDSDIDL